jgi:hypothetical protein
MMAPMNRAALAGMAPNARASRAAAVQVVVRHDYYYYPSSSFVSRAESSTLSRRQKALPLRGLLAPRWFDSLTLLQLGQDGKDDGGYSYREGPIPLILF